MLREMIQSLLSRDLVTDDLVKLKLISSMFEEHKKAIDDMLIARIQESDEKNIAGFVAEKKRTNRSVKTFNKDILVKLKELGYGRDELKSLFEVTHKFVSVSKLDKILKQADTKLVVNDAKETSEYKLKLK